MAVTSMSSSVIFLSIFVLTTFPAALAMDISVNTLCMVCSMKFGQGLYEKFFFVCNFRKKVKHSLELLKKGSVKHHLDVVGAGSSSSSSSNSTDE